VLLDPRECHRSDQNPSGGATSRVLGRDSQDQTAWRRSSFIGAGSARPRTRYRCCSWTLPEL
jgi:hypothetical protein